MKLISFIKTLLNTKPFILPALLILLSTILSATHSTTNIYYLWINIIIIFFTFNFILYQILYFWRNIKVSFLSYIFFSLNILQLSLYLFLFYRIAFYFSQPIFLKDLSLFSQYRYLLLTIITIICFIGFCVSKFFNFNLSSFISFFSFPYLKEEFRLLLDSSPFIYKLSISILHNLLDPSSKSRFILPIIDYIIILFRLIILILFVLFSFYNYDLRILIYLGPLSFLTWILKFFVHYITYIIEGNITYIRELLEINHIRCPLSNLITISFKLTKQGYIDGLLDINLPQIKDKWLKFGNLTHFLKYRKYFKYLSFSIIFFNFICWFYISYVFITKITITNITMGFMYLLNRTINWKPPISIPFYRDARSLYEVHQNQVKQISNNEFTIGHPVYGELLPDGSYRIDDFLTRNPKYGFTISGSPIIPGKVGINQNAVPFSTSIIIPSSYVTPAINGSTAILEAPGIKALLDHIQNNEK